MYNSNSFISFEYTLSDNKTDHKFLSSCLLKFHGIQINYIFFY